MTAEVKARSGYSPYQRGSEWRKWDLHIHTPGTAREDKYTADNIRLFRPSATSCRTRLGTKEEECLAHSKVVPF